MADIMVQTDSQADGRPSFYQAIDFAAHPISKTHSLIVSHGSHHTRVYANEIVHILKLCRPPRTLEEHVRYLNKLSPKIDATTIEAHLQRFVASGALTAVPSAL